MATSTSLPFNQCLDPIPSCKGWDDGYHRLFLTTNEINQADSLFTLAKHKVTGNTIIGVSGFFTLNAASALGTYCSKPGSEIENIILIDRSLRVEHFWKQMQVIITSSSKKEEVISKVTDLLKKEQTRYYPEGSTSLCLTTGIYTKISTEGSVAEYLKELDDEVLCAHSWLSSDDKFARIKRIFDNKHFIFKRMDLFESEPIEAMGKILKERNITVDTIYLSNVYEYAKSPEVKQQFKKAVQYLILPETLVIRTQSRCELCDKHLMQVVDSSAEKPDLFIEYPKTCGHK